MVNYQIIVSTSAEMDIQESFDYYNAQKDDLGYEFYDEIHKYFLLIAVNPFSFPKSVKHTRRCVVRRFPFNIIFTVDKQTKLIIIVAVFHTSRNPADLQNL